MNAHLAIQPRRAKSAKFEAAGLDRGALRLERARVHRFTAYAGARVAHALLLHQRPQRCDMPDAARVVGA